MSTTDSSSLITGCRPLLITTGSRGDVQPFLVLARALSEAGAHPVVAAPRRFDNLAARFGVEFIGLDDSILDLQDELVGAGPVRAVRSLGRIRPLMRRWLNDLAELAHGEAGRADIAVFTQKVLGGASLAERLKIPGLPAQLIPTGPPTSAFRAPLAPVGTPRLLRRASWLLVGAAEAPWRRMVAQWRSARLGLKTRPIPFSRIVATRGILSAWSPRLLAAPPEWHSSQSPLGFWRSRETGTLPPDIERFLADGPPPVVIGFGSMRHDDPARLAREVVDGLRRAGRRGILLAGWSGLSVSGGGDILAVEEAPLGGLLPRAAAIVHHGGVGTVGAALHAGTPQVISPFFGDQSFWAGRLRELGVAPRPLMRITGEALAERLRVADALADTAGALGEVMADEDGCAAAIGRINQVLVREGMAGAG
ncbi:glycosyl transferase family 28 [Actinomyces naeslundii]|uniref:Glycosyl transferase family 28 n=1 Tax=Actinomyces naeslundii TaxID=1655 RepID=A0ABX3F0B6_ACTNA|nr:glycosyltransferase [Actinomyces naeslundii]OLO83296.1 glycosyl transferase family 28 [Actinomyces naeslundii]OLO84396.1 glycosyl transferase family 28 [Actinomyces naeslundii]OMG13435.1 glycosyl transferase family 28 [Actinomyces naeslundii]